MVRHYPKISLFLLDNFASWELWFREWELSVPVMTLRRSADLLSRFHHLELPCADLMLRQFP